MTIAFRRPSLCGALLLTAGLVISLVPAGAHAQTTAETPLDRVLSHTDLAIDGAGEFTGNTTGPNYQGQTAALSPSTTLGALVSLRYSPSSFKGFEINFGYARLTENFTVANTNFAPGSTSTLVLGVQSNIIEYSLGYLAHTRATYFGLQPFASVGAGGLEFTPTKGGGQGLPKQVRLGTYYSVGVDSPLIGNYFGARLAFRQVFYGAPDFNTNYLAAGQRSVTSQPYFGVFARF